MRHEDSPEPIDIEVLLARYLDVTASDGPERAAALLHGVEGGEAVLARVAELQRQGVAAALASHASASPTIAAPPERVGPYVLGELLGRGGMGTVHRATHDDDPRPVALKRLSLADGDTTAANARFCREAAALLRLRHPGIVALIAVGDDRGVPWCAMELVDGPTFEQLLRARAQAPDAAVRDLLQRTGLPVAATARYGECSWTVFCLQLARDAARALGHAHAHGVLHRDVKPGNLMLRRDGSVVVIDFGLAVDPTLRPAVACDRAGSPLYAAPEQLAIGEGPPQPTHDVWSLGVVLGELLTGVHPFAGPSAAVAQQRAARGDYGSWYRLWRALPNDLRAVLRKAMAPSASHRYRDGAELADDLDRYLAGQPVHANVPPAATRTAQFVLRHRVAALAALVLVLLIAVPLRPTHARGRALTPDEAVARGSLDAAADAQPFVAAAYLAALQRYAGLVAERDATAARALLQYERERLRAATSATGETAATDLARAAAGVDQLLAAAAATPR